MAKTSIFNIQRSLFVKKHFNLFKRISQYQPQTLFAPLNIKCLR